jgi:hypothetical protein
MRYPSIAILQRRTMGVLMPVYCKFQGSPDGCPLTIWKKQAMISFNQSRALSALTKG